VSGPAKFARRLATCCLSGLLTASPCLGGEGADRVPTAAELMDDLMWGRGPIGGPFTLTDHRGLRRSSTEFLGKLLVIYFGYRHCPDICPLDLMAITAAIDRLGADGEKVQPFFISVDPERDTPELLAAYIASFHPRLVGFTGTPEEVGKVALAYKAYFTKVAGTRADDYVVDHTSFIYLADRRGEHLGVLPPGTDADRLTTAIRSSLSLTR
jgi:cytochrome oxidase Cu insertion factor (SCO1/SenC/PrrC family)